VKGTLSKVALVVVSLAVYGLLLEWAYRAFIDDGMTYEVEMWKYAKNVKVQSSDPALGHQHRPRAEAKLMGADVRTDANGFRGEDIPERATPGTARIAFVGDSITFGWGVAEQETFASQVLAALKARGRKVDGFNTGVGNYNTAQELNLLRTAGQKLKPDIIVLAYFINDAEPLQKYGQDGWLDWHSMVWTIANYRLDTLLRQQSARADWKDYYRDLYKSDAAGWRATQQAIRGFAELAKGSGAQLVVFNIPELRTLKPYPFADITAQVRGVVEKQDVRFVDLLPSVEAEDPSSLWVTVPDPHPNGKANGLFARSMVETLIPMLDKLCASDGRGC